MKARRRQCYGTILAETFDLVDATCSGCPPCRAQNRLSYEGEMQIALSSTKQGLFESRDLGVTSPLIRHLQVEDELLFAVTDYLSGCKMVDCLGYLVTHGVNIIVIPEVTNKVDILEELALIDKGRYMILTFAELREIGIKWLNGTCALIYSGDSVLDDKADDFSRQYLKYSADNAIIHVTTGDHFVASKNKRLSQLVSGGMIEGERLFTKEV